MKFVTVNEDYTTEIGETSINVKDTNKVYIGYKKDSRINTKSYTKYLKEGENPDKVIKKLISLIKHKKYYFLEKLYSGK